MSTIDPKQERRPKLRQPYEKPAVISEEVFETLALSCAQTNPFTCREGTDRS